MTSLIGNASEGMHWWSLSVQGECGSFHRRTAMCRRVLLSVLEERDRFPCCIASDK